MKAQKYPALILARGGSKEIPLKNIKDFLGKPLIAHTILAAKKANWISEIYVSTDLPEIREVSIQYGARVFERSAEHAQDTSTSEDSWLELATHLLNLGTINRFTPLICLQVTSPNRDENDIDLAIEKYLDGQYDSLFSAVKFEDLTVWYLDTNSGELRPSKPELLQRKSRQHWNELSLVENGSIYIFRLDGLMKSKSRFHGKIGFSIQSKDKLFEIDSVDDFMFVSELMDRKTDKAK